MLKYPWKRTEIKSRLSEIVQQWGGVEPGRAGKLFSDFDFFIEDERLHDDAKSAVGYYIFDDEVEIISSFSNDLKVFVQALDDEFNDQQAVEMPEWPTIRKLASEALEFMKRVDLREGVP